MNNKEFLKSIYEVVNMGYHSCNKLLEDLEGKDNKIISVIEEMKKKYCSFQKDTKKLDKKYKTELEDLGLMAKMGSSMEMKMEVMKDNSDSKIADMLIRGNTMGVVEIEKGKLVNMPRILVPDAKEGDVVKIIIDKDLTKKRQEHVKDLVNDLFID